MRRKLVIFSINVHPEGGGGALATYLLIKKVLTRYFDIIFLGGTRNPSEYILKSSKYIFWPTLKISSKPRLWGSLLISNYDIVKHLKIGDAFYITSGKLIPLIPLIRRIKKTARLIVHLHGFQPLNFTSVLPHGLKYGLKSDIYIEQLEFKNTARILATGFLRNVVLLNRILLGYADKVICVSKRMFKLITDNIPWLKDKCVEIYNPLPEIKFMGKDSEVNSIIYIGGESLIKGFHLVLQAYLHMVKENWGLNLILAKNYSYKLSSIFNALNRLGGRCIVAGLLPRSKLLKYYSKVYSLLFPSIVEEGLPYGVIESMLTGTVPIASRIGGIPEIVHGSFAEKMLFEPGKVNEFLDKIDLIRNLSREELMDIGHGLRESVRRKFKMEEIEKKIIEVFLD